MPEYFAFFIKAKKQSGQQDMLFCCQADSVRVAYSQLYRALTASALHLDDYFTPRRTPLPVGIKLPAEGKLDRAFCRRYHLVGDRWLKRPLPVC